MSESSASSDVIENLTMDIREIQKYLPHRYPFLLVDKVTRLDLQEKVIEAEKQVTINESFFQGHFPGNPIMPGVLILEALAQAGGILFAKLNPSEKISVLLSVNNAKFRSPVHPGDTLHLYCEGLHRGATGGRARGKASVNGKLACQVDIGFALVLPDSI